MVEAGRYTTSATWAVLVQEMEGKKDRAGSNISLIFATIKNTFYLNLGVAGREKRTENMEHRVEGKPEKKTSIFMSQPWKHGTGNPLCPMRNCCPQRSSERIFTMERRNGVLHWNWTRVKPQTQDQNLYCLFTFSTPHRRFSLWMQ